MCEGTVLPHWGHLFRCGACQRLAALRVRNRILDVLRFGTPMAGVYESTFEEENNVEALKGRSGTWSSSSTLQRFNESTLQLQLIQRTPIRFPLQVFLRSLQF